MQRPFFMDYEGKQTVSLEPSVTAATGFDLVVGNAGAAEVKGFEVEAALAITQELLIRGGYTWLDSEYTDFVSLTNSALSIGLVHDCTLQQTPAGFFLCSVDQSGVEMERVPRHNFNVSASYTRAVGNGMNFQFDLLMQYQRRTGHRGRTPKRVRLVDQRRCTHRFAGGTMEPVRLRGQRNG